jgi:bifunctional DNA-binding transcriptional regulator/antitoxin component of YhaV-PrlF toxin-antitoxin module
MSPEVEDETTVNESYSVTVPAAVRREADVQSGDKIRWYVDEDGALSVELVKEQYGVFSRLEPVDIGDPTDAATDQTSLLETTDGQRRRRRKRSHRGSLLPRSEPRTWGSHRSRDRYCTDDDSALRVTRFLTSSGGGARLAGRRRRARERVRGMNESPAGDE